MDLGFETIGNAVLICHDAGPLLVTDPWIEGDAYFGAWTFSHEIPDEQLEAIRACRYVWVSHGHPDHMSWPSLTRFKGQKILLADHVGGRIAKALRDDGFDVEVLPDRTWRPLSSRVRVLSIADSGDTSGWPGRRDGGPDAPGHRARAAPTSHPRTLEGPPSEGAAPLDRSSPPSSGARHTG